MRSRFESRIAARIGARSTSAGLSFSPTASRETRAACRRLRVLLHPIVRRFLRDDDVVHVAFAQPCGAHANELRVALQRRDVFAAAIAHAGAQAAREL